MTDNEIFEAVKQRFTDPKVMDLLRNGLADPEEMEVVKRALRYGDAAMTVPSLRSILYKVFDRLLNVVKDDSTTRQMVKQDLRQLQKGDSAMSEDLNTAINEVTRQKSSVSWTRAVIGPGKSHHSGRGYHELGHSKSDSELESSVHKAVEKGKKTGDVLHHHIQQHDDETRTHHITLNPSVYKDLHHTVAIHTGRPVAHVSFTIPEKHTNMSEDLNTANVEKAIQHDCAKHVVHEQWGKGECIAGEHTLLDDGTVTHYDVMFEHGIEQNVSVADLTILVEMNHGHSRKKKSAMEEAVTPEGGEDTSKASKKGKLEMPLEKLKAIMEKKKSEAYKAMLRSQGKMEEETEYVPTQRSNFIGKRHLKRDHSDELGSRYVFSTDPAKMKKSYSTEKGQKNAANRNVANLKATIKSSLGKHSKPNLPEEVEQIDEFVDRETRLAARKAETGSSTRVSSGDVLGRRGGHETPKHAIARRVGKDFYGIKSGGKTSIYNRSPKPNLPEEAELDEKMLTKAEMKKREEVAKAIKRDNPGMPMGKKMAIATATAKKVAEELVGNQHRIDANKNGKIDAHDFKLLKAKKKTMKEFVEQLAESLVTESEDKHEEVGMHNGDVFKPPNHGGYKSTQDNPKAHENVEKAHHEMVDHIARHLPHMDPKARKETVKDVGSVSKKFHSAMEVDPDSQTDSEAEKIEDHHAEMRKETNHAQKSSGLHSSKTLHGQHGNNPEFKKHHEALKRTLENGDHKSAEETIAAMKGMKGK